MCISNIKNNCRENSSDVPHRRMVISLILNCTKEEDSEEEYYYDYDYDLANVTFINDIWEVVGASEIIIKTIAFIPIVLWGLFGNMALIYVICRNRHLRSPSNLLIGNMALADFLSLMIQPWIFLTNNFFQNYQFGQFGCKTEGTVECGLLLTSVMNLSAISYDRLTAIVLPQETRLTRNGSKIVMGVTWIAGFILALPLFFYRTYKERQWLDFVEKYCSEDTVVIHIYWHVIITMMVWLPLCIMCVCYICIFIKLNRYEKKVLQQKLVVGVKYKAKVAKTMFIVVLAFLICHLPFTALIFHRNGLTSQNEVNGSYKTLFFASRYLMMLNCGINPIIYGLMNEKFCRVFRVTPVIKWIFFGDNTECSKEKKKPTKETVLESNKNKLFTIFKAKSPFAGKQANKKAFKEVTISENHNKIYI